MTTSPTASARYMAEDGVEFTGTLGADGRIALTVCDPDVETDVVHHFLHTDADGLADLFREMGAARASHAGV